MRAAFTVTITLQLVATANSSKSVNITNTNYKVISEIIRGISLGNITDNCTKQHGLTEYGCSQQLLESTQNATAQCLCARGTLPARRGDSSTALVSIQRQILDMQTDNIDKMNLF